jgi:hypothetical protein
MSLDQTAAVAVRAPSLFFRARKGSYGARSGLAWLGRWFRAVYRAGDQAAIRFVSTMPSSSAWAIARASTMTLRTSAKSEDTSLKVSNRISVGIVNLAD